MTIVDLLGSFELPREHTYGKPHVSEDGIRKINRLLEGRHSIVLPPGFAPLIETPRGKFATRVDRFVREFHDKKLYSETKQELGNLVEQYSVKGSSYLFDFTHEVLTWERGSFGNSSSCWRTSYAASVPMFKIGTGFGPGFALRTFRPDILGKWHGGMHGNGRCWITPFTNDAIVMYNPYGERMPVFVSILMSVLPEGMYAVKEVSVTNTSDKIYMNNGAGTVLYPVGDSVKDKLVLDMPRHYTRDCKGCGDKFGTPDRDAIRLCEKCRGKCVVTGKVVRIQDLAEVSDVNVSWKGREHHIEKGLVGLKIQEGMWFCHECLKWRGDLDKC